MINLFSLYFFFINLCGLSFVFKKFFFKSKKIINLDLIYGFYLLLLLAIIGNFFIPLKFLFYPIVFLGTVSFFFNTKYFKLKFHYYFFIILGIFFISLSNGIAIDSLVYHLQIIQKFNTNSIIFGFSNLEGKFGTNNPWQLIMSIFYFENSKINFIYYFNLIIFSILLYQGFILKKKNFSSLFLIFSIFYIFFYSTIHPSGNGTFLTLLGSPDTDIPAAFLCILSIYIFFDGKINNLSKLPFFVLLCFFSKISYAALFIFLINPVFFSKKNIILITIPLILWVLRNIFISGCIIYPLAISCLDLEWANIEAVKTMHQIAVGHTRDTGLKLNYMDPEYIKNTFAWFYPWLVNYFFKNSLIQSVILCSVLAIFTYCITPKVNIEIVRKKIIFFFLFLIFSFFIWFQGPDTRYILGILISMCAYFVSYVYICNHWLNQISVNFKLIFVVLFSLLVIKNHKNIYHFNKSVKNEQFVKNKYMLIDSKNLIYTPKDGLPCADTSLWCVYIPTKLIIKQKFHTIEIINKNE